MTNLVLERMKKDKKQYKVAAELGITQTYLCGLEKGKEKPSLEFGKKLEEYYGKPINYLLEDFK